MQVTTDLLGQFEAGAINPAEFHHRQHVEVVWLYLQRFPAAEVLTRFSAALQQFARSLGKEISITPPSLGPSCCWLMSASNARASKGAARRALKSLR